MVKGDIAMNPGTRMLLRHTIQVLLLVLLVLSSVHFLLLTARAWIPYEYRRASFPADSYGFSTDERIELSALDLNFLLQDLEVSYFDDLTLPDGNPMHNDRELQHFEDVRTILAGSRRVFWGALLALVGLSFVLFRSQGSQVVLESLHGGAVWTLGLIAVLTVGLVVAFGLVFTGFHQLFFDPNTWTFRFSDTFIRLYPQRFWQDVFMYVIGITFLDSGLIYLITKTLLKR